MRRVGLRISAVFVAGILAAALFSVQSSTAQSQSTRPSPVTASPDARAVFDQYCTKCHNQNTKTAGLALDKIDATNAAANAEILEKVVTRLRAGSMPPVGNPRPDNATYHALATSLETVLDRAWAAKPNPGRIGAVHRMNRVEYNNAIRDLLALDVDVRPLLPGDETADGSFDNFADSLSISTAHLERYLSVARQVTRLAIGLAPANPGSDTYEIPLFVLQDDRQSEDLPFGSRGGMAIPYVFPVDGEYTITVKLQRQYQDYLKGMGWAQKLDIRIDNKLIKRFEVGGKAPGRSAPASYAGTGEPGFAGDAAWERYMQLDGDAGLAIRFPVKAGPHSIGVSFVRDLFEPEGLPQPLQRGRVIGSDQVYMENANVGSVQIGGPFTGAGTAKDTPSRRAIFVCEPRAVSEERACASRILSRMARLAYRRPLTGQDLPTLIEFFDAGRSDGKSFDAGIQYALERLLVDPDFLLRVYRDPAPTAQAATYKLSDIEVASRLSFFLWSSIPDERLIALAERGQLTTPANLEKEVRRMLADPRAPKALTDNFAAQWLNLRRVEEVVVDQDKYPHYDLSLMQGFQKETELFVASTIEEDRSVSNMLDADYTFVNERLARHYGISGVYGSRFQRVTLPNRNERGGLLAHGALLSTTSYPDRTSPVLRGKWLLNNILGLHVPPPPPGVDTNLESKPGQAPQTIRQRLAQHRENPSCNSCHAVIDPLGFALENYDVIGGWRTIDEVGKPVDTAGSTLSGVEVNGLTGLRKLLLADREAFPRTLTAKLMAYALGRRIEYYDEPAVRKIVRDAAGQNYRWSSIIQGIVESPAFLTRSRT
jgi:mono/diheme cytochrome c family protein